ncbi:helix-turn-helix transcriptional regulator [Streptomyces olivaceus]|uniref:helix-turn-helix transcriptional regulator n=1 Tax=Streptomyces olivaceus TaxID=47716 RepID=UPI00380AEDEA
MNTEIPEAQEWMSPKTAAARYEISTITLERWRRENIGPAYSKLGSAANASIRYRRKDFDAWVKANLVTPSA